MISKGRCEAIIAPGMRRSNSIIGRDKLLHEASHPVCISHATFLATVLYLLPVTWKKEGQMEYHSIASLPLYNWCLRYPKKKYLGHFYIQILGLCYSSWIHICVVAALQSAEVLPFPFPHQEMHGNLDVPCCLRK